MISKFGIVLLISFFSLYASIDKFSCHDGPLGGFYCSHDRRGYINCNKDEPLFNKRQFCPTDTRCSCFINTKCIVKESKICQSLKKPYLPKSFDITFNLKTIEVSAAERKTSKIVNRAIVNGDLMKFSSEIKNLESNEKSFEVVEKSGNGFVKYQGTYPNSCSKMFLNKFPGSFINPDDFQLTKKDGNIETFEFRVGTRKVNAPYYVIKSITYERNGRNSKPLEYKQIYGASSFNATVVDFSAVKRDASFFKVPVFCDKE